MSQYRLHRTVGLALVAVMAAACTEQSTTSPPISRGVVEASADLVAGSAPQELASVGWQEQARTLVAANKLSPLAAVRVYAALSVAEYQAVVGIPTPERARAPRAVEERRGAVAGASVQVLSFFFPAAATSLEQRVTTESDAVPDKLRPFFTRGVASGRVTGTLRVELTKTDRFTTPWTGTVPVGPGMWIANGPPAGATFGGVRPYFLTSGNQFRPAPPPAFGSESFLADLSEVRTLASNRTSEQLASALYWNFPTGTMTPPGYWDRVAGDYIAGYGLDERAATRAFALMNAAMMDALIGCFDAKYYYWTIRPSQADPAITLVLGLPNHPSYASAHSCVSSAAATVLSSLFPQRSEQLNTWVTQAGLSRMYAGIHYRFDIDAGRELGKRVARWALEHATLIDVQPDPDLDR